MATVSDEDLEEFLSGTKGVVELDMARELVSLRKFCKELQDKYDGACNTSNSFQQGLEETRQELEEVRQQIAEFVNLVQSKFGGKNGGD